VIETYLKDLHRAARNLYRVPTFSIVVLLTLGLGIGGTATMFTAVNAAFLRPLPYPDADRLVMVWQTLKGFPRVNVSMLDALDWQSQNRSFERMAVLGAGGTNIKRGTDAERVLVGYVTRDFFATLGVPPVVGRTFTADEAVRGGPHTVVIGYRLWRHNFQQRREVLNEALTIDGLLFNVIGVMPEGFDFPDHADLWLPLYTDDNSSRSAHNYRVVARLKHGIALASAQTDMHGVEQRIAQLDSISEAGVGIWVEPLRQSLLGRTGPILLLLMGAVLLVLLIACVNVTNLLLVRSVVRIPETTVRLALGASRSALLRPLLLESVALATLGGLLGLLLALAATRLLSGLAPANVLDPKGFHVDGMVLLFTFLVALAVGLLCGLAPAWRASRLDLRTSLAAGGRGMLGGHARRGMTVLIVVEVATAFVLLVGAGLLLRTVRQLTAVQPGFQPQGVSLLSFDMAGSPGSRYENPEWRVRFFSQLLDRVTTLPGIEAAGLISEPPLSGKSFSGGLVVDEPGGDALGRSAHFRAIGGEYFKALGIGVLRGRPFLQQDAAGQPVAIVNELLAHSLAVQGDILGKRIKMPGMDGVDEWATIVGIVSNVHHLGLGRDPVPEAYFPYFQRPKRTWEMTLVVRGRQDLASLRDILRALDPNLPLRPERLNDMLDADLAQPRFRAKLLGTYAAIALLLAAIGIFGVVSYSVSQRHKEVGIRMALGADTRAVERLMLRTGISPVLVGIGLGFLMALALARFLANLLFGVEATDLVTFVSVAVVLAASALVASYVPARRATQVDPLVVLRTE